MWNLRGVSRGPDASEDLVTKARARIEFGKFNFASDFYHCRFYTPYTSTTIFNAIFVSGTFSLVSAVRFIHQVRFFLCGCDLDSRLRYRKTTAPHGSPIAPLLPRPAALLPRKVAPLPPLLPHTAALLPPLLPHKAALFW